MRNTPGANNTYPGKILKRFQSTKGYLWLDLYTNRKHIIHRIAQLVALCFLGPCPNGKEINHKNGKKTDDRIENLEYITHAHNIQHAWTLGLHKFQRGEAGPNVKLTEQDVFTIIKLRKLGWTQQQIANQFNVTQATIWNILSGKTWSSVTGIK